ncbi:uncharacterized protein LOC143918092 [Arctopsyche grandis]|uniref:uncharacterized protein LOC143918092 n=1 Tax=Arctopsyche grandis TaxID=121162 RepID=UPI00406D82D5
MTRFARAHGSKASNERMPEAATPWSIMRTQLQQSQDQDKNAAERAKCEAQRKENYEKFLKEQSDSKIKKSWCTFDDDIKSGETKQIAVKNAEAAIEEDSKRVSKNKLKKMKKALEVSGEIKQVKTGDKNGSFNVEENCEKTKNIISKKNKNKDATLDSTESENDEDISNWLAEYEDQEIDNKFVNLTSQIEKMLKKSKKDKSDLNEVGESNKKKTKSNNKSSEFTVSETIPKTDEMEVDKIPDSITKTKNKKRKQKEEICTNDIENNESENCNVPESKKRKVSEPSNADTIDILTEKKNKKKKKKTAEKMCETEIFTANDDIIDAKVSIETKTKKKNKKSQEVIDNVSESNTDTDLKIKKKNKKIDQSSSQTLPDTQEMNVNSKKNKNKKKKEINPVNSDNQNKNSKPLTKSEKKASNEEFKRRKPSLETSVLIINGEELVVSIYDGFPILSKDAERLQDLRKNLISKGIPRSEVNRTMKLERRKAEKSLARMKKKLCFHCRKGGHNLSECPELNKKTDDTGMPSSGICFKCGSTEHTHFACKVVRTQDYKFAQCFICKEQGHISRQCPDNPRGLYPKGGGCRECGDVTHLKKDCPKIVKEREDNSMKLDMMDSGNVEDVSKKPTVVSNKNPSIKHIKF